MLMHYLVKAYVLLIFVLFALAVLDLIVAYTPFDTLYGFIHHTGSVVLVIWAVTTLIAVGWGIWDYLFHA